MIPIRLCVIVAATIAAFLSTAPADAQQVFYVSANGTGDTCTAAQPCAFVATALGSALQAGQVICVGGSGVSSSGVTLNGINGGPWDVDCPQGYLSQLTVQASTGAAVTLRHLTFNSGNSTEIVFESAGTLTLDDCVLTEAEGGTPALSVTGGVGPVTVVIRNSRILNSSSGILLKPQSLSSINATLDHVEITGNQGGGIRADSTNGPITLDVTDSVISNNAGSGINALGNAGNQVMVSIKNSVIAKNGGAGVQANGANAGVLVQTTLFDQNTVGATSIVNGGHVSTYGNNSIVGSAGSGFNGAPALQ